ncbi:hypothetical protein GM415_06650 [Pseudodesulfovibrio cashew]|uniref:DUF4292 domain-containing protein n=1 Tax=Pseudodesulfovibrio cashew TaxID=2678688 RepID=A0A6I6JH29_9BACT|nr:hypothetical protein [Pseudodesulfovibrio cashew]QGY39813.1 hypothetical protein GM415_06650 [Pseudodesulfovibrio cashew]
MIRSIGTRILPALLLTGLALAVAGCAARKVNGTVRDTPEAAWQAFRTGYCATPKAPGLLVRASLYYTRTDPVRRTNRTLVSLWGDFGGPMRLDVSASVGKLLAHIREDHCGLLVFYPSEKKAYAHVNPVLGATRLGMPFPFSLNELGKVAMGDFSGLSPKTYRSVRQEEGRLIYTVDGAPASMVVLDVTGRPLELAGTSTSARVAGRQWRLAVDRYEEDGASPLPAMLTLSMDNGEKGVLRIKSRELKIDGWSAEATGLTLPGDVTPLRLDNGMKSAGSTGIPAACEDKK